MAPVCFVVMGFGKKTDLATGRELDLDKSYKSIIKPAVLAAGFQCINLADGTEHNHEPTERISVDALEGIFEVAIALVDEAGKALQEEGQ